MVKLNLDELLALDSYRGNHDTGGLIIIDRLNNETVGAGLIREALLKAKDSAFSAFELELNAIGTRRHFPHLGYARSALEVNKMAAIHLQPIGAERQECSLSPACDDTSRSWSLQWP